VAAVNAAGGVKGHKLVLSMCDTTFTANGEVACARKIVAAKPAVSIAPFLVADGSGASWPILLAAKIPAIGGQGGTQAELNSTNSFPLGSGFLGPFVGTAEGIFRTGAKNITILNDDPNPAAPIVSQLITGALKARGITKVNTVTGHTASDPTFATAAAQATAGGVDGIVLNGSPNTVATMVKALRSGGYKGKLATPSLLLPPQVITALGADAEGIIVVSANAFVTDTTNNGIVKYKADMKKYRPTAPLDDASLQAWSAVQLFVQAASRGTRFDAFGLMATFRNIKKPIDIKTSGPWSVVGKLGKVPGFARIVNPTVTFGVVKSGKVVPQGKGFTNPLGG
jgi:ABC-type branched-subunit amino acid transport system substrate-binding protein